MRVNVEVFVFQFAAIGKSRCI